MSDFQTVWSARHAREMLEFEVDATLRKKGWKHTCESPGSLWLWEKVVRWTRHERTGPVEIERLVMTDKDTALSIQERLDAHEVCVCGREREEHDGADGEDGVSCDDACEEDCDKQHCASFRLAVQRSGDTKP